METATDGICRQGDKQMLTKVPFNSQHDLTTQRASGEALTTVGVGGAAANAGSWINEETKGRRLRRQRRMERSTSLRVNGWSVRTW
jgi:hypothetical protein